MPQSAAMEPNEIPGRVLGGAREADDPWAFTPEGLDWRWLPRKQAAERVRRVARELREPLQRSPAWSFSPESTIATLLLDAALLSLGLSVAATPRVASGGEGVSVEIDDQAQGRVTSGWRFARREAESPSLFQLCPASGAVDDQSCSGEGWQPRRVDELWRAVDQVPAGTGHDVLVTSADLSRFEERCAWLWALRRGASLVVCRAAEVPAAVGWARPTTLWLAAPAEDMLDRVLSFCGGSSDRSKRRALRRLRQVVCVGEAPSSELERRCAGLGLGLRFFDESA
ncbi:MAG: hypothetical protein AAGK22_12495 [Acidobacteriota bacterium]